MVMDRHNAYKTNAFGSGTKNSTIHFCNAKISFDQIRKEL